MCTRAHFLSCTREATQIGLTRTCPFRVALKDMLRHNDMQRTGYLLIQSTCTIFRYDRSLVYRLRAGKSWINTHRTLDSLMLSAINCAAGSGAPTEGIPRSSIRTTTLEYGDGSPFQMKLYKHTEYLQTTQLLFFKGLHSKGTPLRGISSRKHIANILSSLGGRILVMRRVWG